jgi:hypothetical protein
MLKTILQAPPTNPRKANTKRLISNTPRTRTILLQVHAPIITTGSMHLTPPKTAIRSGYGYSNLSPERESQK